MPEENKKFVLCGGTFLTLLLLSRKPTKTRRQRTKGETDAFLEQDVLQALVEIANPDYPTPAGGTFKTVTSKYKRCEIDTPDDWDFVNNEVVSAFIKKQRKDYRAALSDMIDFVVKFIDVESVRKNDVLLVKRLIELIQSDDGAAIFPFVVAKDGTTKSSDELTSVSAVHLPAFLLSVWTFIVDKRRGANKIGVKTISAWHPDEKENKAQGVYKGLDGTSIEQDIRVTFEELEASEDDEEDKTDNEKGESMNDENANGYDENDYLIAISHAGQNSEFIASVVENIHERFPNIVFYDKRKHSDIEGRADLKTYLRDIFLNKAKFVIVFMSKEYTENEITQLEFEFIWNRYKNHPGRQDIVWITCDGVIHDKLKTNIPLPVSMMSRSDKEIMDTICAKFRASRHPLNMVDSKETTVWNTSCNHPKKSYLNGSEKEIRHGNNSTYIETMSGGVVMNNYGRDNTIIPSVSGGNVTINMGASSKQSPADFYRGLFIILESKRILTYPMHKEREDECIESVLDLKKIITTEAMQSRLPDYETQPARSMVRACNDFLDVVRPIRGKGYGSTEIDGEHRDLWGEFTRAVETFRDAFKSAIAEIERRHDLRFTEDTSQPWY